MKTIIEYFGKYYLAKRMDKNMKDKCLNCPLNSQCADEEETDLCKEYGLQDSMYIVNEIEL